LWPSGCFRDDGISSEEPASHVGQVDMAEFLKKVDEWMKVRSKYLFE
jgi:hypothetical protein